MKPLYKIFLSGTFLLIFLLIANQQIKAADYNDATSGDWNAIATWGGVGPPGAGDNVVIDSHTVTLDANKSATNVTVSTGGTLNVGAARSITVSNTLLLNGGTITNTVGGGTPNVTIIANTFTQTSGTVSTVAASTGTIYIDSTGTRGPFTLGNITAGSFGGTIYIGETTAPTSISHTTGTTLAGVSNNILNSSGDIGSSGEYMEIAGGGNAQADATKNSGTGDIYLNRTGGSLSVITLIADSSLGDVYLKTTTSGSISVNTFSSAYSATVDSRGAVSIALSGGASTVRFASITAAAGNITSTGNSRPLIITGPVAATGGNVSISGYSTITQNSGTTISSSNSSVALSASSDITVGGISSATTTSITATGGHIYGNISDTIACTTLTLSAGAAKDIGKAATSQPLQVNTSAGITISDANSHPNICITNATDVTLSVGTMTNAVATNIDYNKTLTLVALNISGGALNIGANYTPSTLNVNNAIAVTAQNATLKATTITFGASGTLTTATNGDISLYAEGVSSALKTVTSAGALSFYKNTTSATYTLEADISATGTLTINSGVTLSAASYNINVGGDWANSGTFTAGSSTVTFNGSNAQTMDPTTFNLLTIANTHASDEVTITSGTVTTTSRCTVSDGIFNIDTGKTLDINYNAINAVIISSGATLKVDGGTVTLDGGTTSSMTVSAGGTLNIVSGSVTALRSMSLSGKLKMAGGTLYLGISTSAAITPLTIGAAGGADIGDITGGTIYLTANTAAIFISVTDGGKFLPAITTNDTGNLVIFRKFPAGTSVISNASTAPNYSNVRYNRLQVGDAGYPGSIGYSSATSAPLYVYNKLTINTANTFTNVDDPIYADKFVCDGTYTKTALADMFFMIDGDGIAANGSISGTTDPLFGNLDIGSGSAVTVTLERAITADSLDIAANGVLDTGANQTITVNGAVTNAGTLTLNNSSISVSGDFTNSNTLNAGGSTVTFNGSGAQTISGTSVFNIVTLNTRAAGTVGFTGNTTITTFTVNGAGAYDVSFTGTTNVFTNLVEFLNTGTVTLSDDAGDSITFNGGIETAGNASNPSSTNIAGSLTTSNDVITLGPVSLTAATTLNSGGGIISITSIAGGGFDLTLAAGIGAGTTTVSGAVSNLGDGTGACLTVSLGVSGLVTFQSIFGGNSGISNITAPIRFNDDVTLANGDTGTTIVSTSQLDGLNWSSYDGITFANFTTISGGAVSINSNNGTISFTAALDGAQALSLTSGTGTINFLSTIGSFTPLSSLTINNTAPAIANFNASAHTIITGALIKQGTGDVNLSSANLNTGGLTISAGTFNNDANDSGGWTIAGDVSIAGTLKATSGTFNVSGNWDNNGTFTSGAGTVTFNGLTSATFEGGASTYNNIQINKTSGTDANDNLTLQTDAVTINGTLIISDGELIQDPVTNVNITTGAVTLVDSSSKWTNNSDGDVTLSGNVSNTGTISFAATTPTPDGILIRSLPDGTQYNWQGLDVSYLFSITDVNVKDQTCLGGTPANIPVTSGTDSGHNVNWLFGTSTISGTAYTDDTEVTKIISTAVTVVVYASGIKSTYTTTTSDPGGTYSVINGTLADNDIICVYLDTTGATKGTTVYRAGGAGSVSGLNVYQNHLVVFNADTTNMTNDDLYNVDDGDADVIYLVSAASGGNLTVDNNIELFLEGSSSKTFAPGGNITVQGTGDLQIESGATLSMAAKNLIVDDDIRNAGIITQSGGTTTINGTTKLLTGAGTTTFNNFIVNGTYTQDTDITVSATLTINDNESLSLDALSQNVTLEVGNTIVNNGNADGEGIVLLDSTNAITIKGTAGGLRPLTNNNIDFNTKTVHLDNIDVQVATSLDENGDSIVLDSNCTFDAITLNGNAATSFTTSAHIATVGGTLTNTFGTVTISNNGEIDATGQDILQGANGIFTLAGTSTLKAVNITNAGTIDLDSNNSVVDITGNITNTNTIDATGTSSNIRLEGNWDNTGGAFSCGSSTVTFDGAGSQTLTGTLTGNTGKFYNLTINNSHPAPDDANDVDANQIEVSNTLIVNDGQFQPATNSDFNDVTINLAGILKPDNAATINIGGDFDNSAGGTFTHNTGTVTLNGSSAQTVTTGGSSFNTLVVTNTGNYVTFDSAVNCANFTAQTASSKMKFKENANFTVTGTLSLNGAAGTEIELISTSVVGVKWNLVSPATAVSFVKVKDSNCTNGSVTASNSINLGGNDDGDPAPHWIFSSVTRYWVGVADGEDWDDNNNWSSTSGGAGGANYPQAGDTAIFDGKNLNSVNDCLLDANVSVAVIQLQGAADPNGAYTGKLDAGGFDITTSSTLDITSGELELDAGSDLETDGVLTIDGGTLDGLNGTINADNNVVLSSGTLIAPSGNFNVAGNFTISGGAFTHSSGTVVFDGVTTLTSNGQILNDVQIGTGAVGGSLTLADQADINGNLTVQNGGATTLNLTNQTLLFGGATFNLTNLDTFTVTGSTVTFDRNALQTVTSDSNIYNIITVTNASVAVGVVFADDFTTATLNAITQNSKLTFNAGDIYTITGAAGLNLNGQAVGTEVTILSDNPGTQFTFDVTGGAQTVNRVHVTDSAAESNNITATNSINNGGNDDGDPIPHWIFGNVTIDVPSAGTTVGQTPTIIGTSTPGDTVIITGTVGGIPFQQVASITADANGNYRVKQSDYTANLDIGPNSIRAEVGVVQSAVVNITVDATPNFNEVPTITSPTEGSFVRGNKPTITGRGLAGQALILTLNDANGNLLLTDVATTTVDGLGNWTISSADYTTNLVKGINYLSVTVAGTASDIRSIILTDPFGIVFDSVNNNPIEGATVTIFTSAGVQCTRGVEIAAADSNPQTTGADGFYSFLTINGDFYITISAPGYNYPSTKTSFPAGRAIVTGSRGQVFTVAGAVIEMDHPLDPNNLLLKIKKDVNKKEVVIGDVLTYTITIKNETASDVTNVYLEDMIPAGFKYINDRTILDNRSISDPTGDRPILFNIGTVSAGGTRTLKYQLVIGSGVTVGDYKNTAVCKYLDGTVISNRDSETVQIVLDPLFDLGTIIGKVFWDLDENRIQKTDDRSQITETGIAGVQIVMEDGTVVTTDKDGKYHLAAIIPGRHVLRINERTLPKGAYLTTDKVVIVDITPGILSKVNFGVNSKDRRQGTEDRNQKIINKEQNKIEAKTDNRKPITENSEDKLLGELTNEQANMQTSQPTNIQTSNQENYLLFVAMGDAKAGYNFNRGDMEPVEDSDRFKDGFWSEGKFAYYLKGKIKGKYLITSSLDTEREKKELFRNLDPDKYYPVYGDASIVNYNATDTQGQLYLLIEWDKSKILWGNYTTGLTDTEFAQFNRTLYGGKIHLETVSLTKFGEPFTKLIVFDARAKQRAAHNEFLGTGGSLFYLKNSNVIEGSEKIEIEVRDKTTGLVLTTKQMQEGSDYEIDYSNGRIIFWQPISYIVESTSIISSSLLDGNPVYVVVDYEYETKDKYDKGAQGARLKQSLTDYINVGGTYVKEEQADKDYELKGVDATIHLGKNVTITAEQAESKSEQAESFISTDGGLSFTELATSDNDKGKAYGIKGKAHLFGQLDLTNYYKKIEEGFSSTSTTSQQGKELFGTGITWDLTSRTKLTVSHDVQKLIDDGNQQTQLQVGAKKTKSTTAQVTHQMEKLRLTGEYRHQEVTDKSEDFESETNKDEDAIAAKADYKLTEKVAVSLEQQATLKGKTNNQTSVGVSAQPNEYLSFKAKETVGTEGSATSVGTTFNVDNNTDVSATVAVSNSFEKGKTQSVVLGSQRKLNEELALTTDRTYAKNRDTSTEGNTFGLTREKDGKKIKGTFTEQQSQNNNQVANTNIFGLSGDINDKLAMTGSFERGVVQNHDSSEATRSAGALGVSYVDKNPETEDIRIRASSKLELRTDDGEEDKKQYLVYNAVEWKSTINTTLFAKSNISQTENTSDDSTEAQYKELVTGIAYRPVYFDRLNLLAKYTYLEDDSPQDQDDFSDIEKERAHTVSTEAAYDLTNKWQFVEKLAYKFGEEKVTGFDFTKTQTWLMIHRLNYNINENWQIGAEYRRLTQKEAKDYKEGVLLEASRKIGEFVQIGAGYNFTEFNDDLTHLDYTSQGPFIRLTATLYDRTPEEIERALQKSLEKKINQWTWELVNKELANPSSPIMQRLYYYYNLAEKLSSEGKLKEAKQLYERITQTGQMMYNEAEEYIRGRIELEKKIKEEHQFALEYYKQGKLAEAKKLWEKIIKEASPEPIFLEF